MSGKSVFACIGGIGATAIAMCLLLGCNLGTSGQSDAPDSGAAKADGGADDANDGIQTLTDPAAAAAACKHYYAAQYQRCGGPVLPKSEQTRSEGRFVQVCLNDMVLPGSGMSPDSVEACASALDASPCELPDGLPMECNFHGSRASEVPCNRGVQCQSGQCTGTAAISPGGPIGPSTCGTCAPFVALGQVCAHGDGGGGCAVGQICMVQPGTQTSSQPSYACVAIKQGDVGSTCDDISTTCKIGLYCSAQSGQCATLGDAGAPCGQGASPPGAPGGCVAPLACVGVLGMTYCSSGMTGAFCLSDFDCSSGLGCAPGPCSKTVAHVGCSAAGTCQPVQWVSPGQACDGYRTRCITGACGSGSGVGPPQLAPTSDGGQPMGTCPTIASDGQPCSSPCDTFAGCFTATGKAGTPGVAGTCTLLDSVVCK
jgi:hypothetical protein